MASSKGWRSWPYYLDPVEEQEISLGSGCIKHLELEFPRVDGFPTSGIRARLSDEQRANIVEGF